MQKPELDDGQREQAARVIAMLEGLGPSDDLSGSRPALRAITRDRIVLGDVLGDYLHRVMTGSQSQTVSYWPVLELLRSAGADEERAATKAAWLRTAPLTPPQ